jgi:hypothetical protein
VKSNLRSVVGQLFVGAILPLAALSCIGRDPPSISSRDPDQLIPAIKQGVQAGDRSIIPYLVTDLESEDSAVRFYAIDGLRRLTGQDFGYQYFDDPEKQKPAVDRWKQWLSDHRH